MPLHPQAKPILEALAAEGGKPIEKMTPREVRASRAQHAEAMAVVAGPEQPVARVENRSIPGPGGPIPVRIYWPLAGKSLPVLVYLHGGGLVFGNLDSVDRNCRVLANSAQCVVVNVEYRLAPENKFPAPAEDAYAVVTHVAEHAVELEIDARQIAIGGGSAGGNLATVACLMAGDRGGPPLVFQLLVYPVTEYDDSRPSLDENEGYLLTRKVMQYFWGHYVASPEQGRHSCASPIKCRGPRWAAAGDGDYRRVRPATRPGRSLGAPPSGGWLDSGREAVADAASALRNAFAASMRAPA